MFQVKNLTITHKKDLTTLVEGLSFTLAPGDRAAVIGEEGNGKSTVLKLLYDSALAEPYAEWTGEIVDKGLRKGYLAQELTPEELALSVWELCQRTPAFGDADPRALDRAARQVGLAPEVFWDGRPMSTLSGGERVKLRLALLLLACLIGLMILMGWESAGLVLQFFGMFALAPLALGLGFSLLAYYLYWKKRPPAEDPARPWKRQ